MVDGRRGRVGGGVAVAGVLLAVVSVAGHARQAGSSRASANPAQQKYPYPAVRDQRGIVPPGPRLLPSPPLGAGPAFQNHRSDKFAVGRPQGIPHPYGVAFLPDGTMLVTERVGALRAIRNGVLDPNLSPVSRRSSIAAPRPA